VAGKSLRLMGHIERSEAAEAARAAARLLPAFQQGGDDQDLGSHLDPGLGLGLGLDGAQPQPQLPGGGDEAGRQHCLAALVCQQLQVLLQQAQQLQPLALQGPESLPGSVCELAAAAGAALGGVDGAAPLLGLVLRGETWEEGLLPEGHQPAAVEGGAGAAAAAAAADLPAPPAGGWAAKPPAQPSPRSVLEYEYEEGLAAAGSDDADNAGDGTDDADDASWQSEPSAAAEQQQSTAAAGSAGDAGNAQQQRVQQLQLQQGEQQGEPQDANHHLQWCEQMLHALEHGGVQPQIDAIRSQAPVLAAGEAVAGTALLLRGLWPLGSLPQSLPELGGGGGGQGEGLVAPNGAVQLQALLAGGASSSTSPAVEFMLGQALRSIIAPRVGGGAAAAAAARAAVAARAAPPLGALRGASGKAWQARPAPWA
jgi:hypothetical protein